MKKYTAEDIRILKPLEAIRLRPGMYIGDVEYSGYHHLAVEVLNNSIDEHLAGEADTINVRIIGNRIDIWDNGRGIPWKIHPTHKISTLTAVLTNVHSGGKFGGGSYSNSKFSP